MQITFVTRNARKFQAALLVLEGITVRHADIQLTEIQGESSAIITHKINEAARQVKPPFFVDDTLLHMPALHGLPGPYINDFSTKLGPDGLWQLIAGFEDKRAEAVALIGLSMTDGTTCVFEGRISGTIVAPRGTVAFGWDPIFQPDGYEQTFAEMGVAGKSKISHRAQAFNKMRDYIRKHS